MNAAEQWYRHYVEHKKRNGIMCYSNTIERTVVMGGRIVGQFRLEDASYISFIESLGESDDVIKWWREISK